MILQSKDDFDKLAEFDSDTGSYRFLSRKDHPEISFRRPSGAFSILSDTVLSLYRKDSRLYFRVEDLAVELADNVTSVLTHENNNRVFQLVKNGKPEVVFRCLPPVYDVPFAADPTPL